MTPRFCQRALCVCALLCGQGPNRVDQRALECAHGRCVVLELVLRFAERPERARIRKNAVRFQKLRARLGEVAAAHPAWAPLVADWDTLATLYVSGLHEQLGRRIRAATATSPRSQRGP